MAIQAGVKFDVTVIGEIYLDHVFSGFTAWPLPGEEIFTEEYTAELGGGAVTTACALANLGRSVQLVGIVGAAQFTSIQKRLAEFGISSDLLIQSAIPTGVTVSISTAQDRSFFTYRGANRELQSRLEGNGMLLQQAAGARHVHMAFPLSPRACDPMLEKLRSRGATTSLDVGHQVEWLSAGESRAVLAAVDYFLPNEREAAILAGDASSYLSLSKEIGLRSAVVKLGAAGATMLVGGITYQCSAPAAQVVDTTGAGDAFDAGLIDGMLAGWPTDMVLQHACACGTLSTTAAGALGALPTRAEVEEVLERHHVA